MAKKLGRIILITTVVLVVITGIVIGVLFALGVLKIHKSGSSGNTPGPHPTPPTPGPPGPFNPAVSCEQMPTVTSFTRLQKDGNFRLTFSPIAENCAESKSWIAITEVTSLPMQYTGTNFHQFSAIAGQSFVDIEILPKSEDPHSPVKAITGQVWLRTVNADGTGDLKDSNQLSFAFTNI